MEPIPAPPPEAELIRLAREATGMNASAAARRMAEICPPDAVISAAYWRDVERGQGGRRGKRVTVRASDKALAWMAVVVSLTPERLEGAGRDKAAEILREILGHGPDTHGHTSDLLTPAGRQLWALRGYGNRETFAAGHGLPLDLVRDTELGTRPGFTAAEIRSLAAAYGLGEASLRAMLDGTSDPDLGRVLAVWRRLSPDERATAARVLEAAFPPAAEEDIRRRA
jgi:hypothetical protein